MALIKTGAVISDIIGKVGGHVFQRTLGGLTLRSDPGHINPRSSTQMYLRSGTAWLQAQWRALSAADALSWTAYASFVNKSQHKNILKKQSPQNLFIAENIVRWKMSQSVVGIVPLTISTPTLDVPQDQITIVSVTRAGAALNVFLDRAIASGASYLMLKMSRPLKNSQASQYNKLLVIPFAQSSADTFNVASAYTATFGTLLTTGDYVNSEIVIASLTLNPISQPVRQRLQVL